MIYDADELRRRPKSQPLPADINEMAEALAAPDRFDCPELLKMLQSVKAKRLFGKCHVHNAHNQLICTVAVQSGICERITFADIYGSEYLARPFSVVFIRSVKNQKLIHSRRTANEGEDDETR